MGPSRKIFPVLILSGLLLKGAAPASAAQAGFSKAIAASFAKITAGPAGEISAKIMKPEVSAQRREFLAAKLERNVLAAMRLRPGRKLSTARDLLENPDVVAQAMADYAEERNDEAAKARAFSKQVLEQQKLEGLKQGELDRSAGAVVARIANFNLIQRLLVDDHFFLSEDNKSDLGKVFEPLEAQKDRDVQRQEMMVRARAMAVKLAKEQEDDLEEPLLPGEVREEPKDKVLEALRGAAREAVDFVIKEEALKAKVREEIRALSRVLVEAENAGGGAHPRLRGDLTARADDLLEASLLAAHNDKELGADAKALLLGKIEKLKKRLHPGR